jgi:hypothetical protein
MISLGTKVPDEFKFCGTPTESWKDSESESEPPSPSPSQALAAFFMGLSLN